MKFFYKNPKNLKQWFLNGLYVGIIIGIVIGVIYFVFIK